jgi:hypothetical protein
MCQTSIRPVQHRRAHKKAGNAFEATVAASRPNPHQYHRHFWRCCQALAITIVGLTQLFEIFEAFNTAAIGVPL